MPEMSFGEDDFQESREAALAAAELARSPDAFKEAFEAFRTSDGERFRAALEPVGLLDRCRLICIFFCRKHCIGVCRRFCPGEPPDVTADEVREFALAFAQVGDEQLRGLAGRAREARADALLPPGLPPPLCGPLPTPLLRALPARAADHQRRLDPHADAGRVAGVRQRPWRPAGERPATQPGGGRRRPPFRRHAHRQGHLQHADRNAVQARSLGQSGGAV